MTRQRWIVAAVAAFVTLSGCGSITTASSTPSSSASAGGGDSSSGAGSSAAQAVVTAHSNTKASPDKFPLPKTPVAPGSHTMVVISCDNLSAACRQQADFLAAAGKAAGWTVEPVRDGKSDTALITQYVNQAVQAKIDVIGYASAITLAGQSAVAAASAAGIVQIADNDNAPAGLAKVVASNVDAGDSGHTVGAYIVASSGGNPTGVFFRNVDYAAAKARMTGIMAAVKQYAPDAFAKMPVVDFPASDLSKPGPPFFTAQLSKHPSGSFGWAATPFDSLAVPIAQTLTSQGRANDVKVNGLDGSADAINYVQRGTITTTVSIPAEFEAWTGVDLAIRELAGQPLYKANSLPYVLVTKDNVGPAVSNGYWDPGFDFKSTLTRLWGRS